MKIPKKIDERRRSIRIEESLPFKIGHKDYDVEAVTINISSHGAMCLVEKSLPLMTQLSIALSLPALGETKNTKPKTIHAKGVIVRREPDPASDKHFLAIFFSDIKPSDQKALDEFIHKRVRS